MNSKIVKNNINNNHSAQPSDWGRRKMLKRKIKIYISFIYLMVLFLISNYSLAQKINSTFIFKMNGNDVTSQTKVLYSIEDTIYKTNLKDGSITLKEIEKNETIPILFHFRLYDIFYCLDSSIDLGTIEFGIITRKLKEESLGDDLELYEIKFDSSTKYISYILYTDKEGNKKSYSTKHKKKKNKFLTYKKVKNKKTWSCNTDN